MKTAKPRAVFALVSLVWMAAAFDATDTKPAAETVRNIDGDHTLPVGAEGCYWCVFVADKQHGGLWQYMTSTIEKADKALPIKTIFRENWSVTNCTFIVPLQASAYNSNEPYGIGSSTPTLPDPAPTYDVTTYVGSGIKVVNVQRSQGNLLETSEMRRDRGFPLY